MNTATLTTKETAALKKMYTAVKQCESSGKTMTAREKHRMGLLVEDLRNNYGTITTVLNPEVPAETQKMFFELEELYWKDHELMAL